LCRAHHTVVHAHGYAGRVVAGPSGPRVEWDLTSGSYHRRFQQWRGECARSTDEGGPPRP
ncbi:MAG TPA: hypothetical protein VGN19_13350, partial [Pedococcus sp.]|nr:hypothetical protein [Pedococcus sp.]